MKYVWRLIFILAMAVLYVGYSHPDWIVDPPFIKVSALSSDKCYDNCTDPNRPSFDQWGNEFDYQGNFLKLGSCDADPITGQANPHCPAPRLTTSGSVVDNQIVNQSFEGK